MNKVLIGLIVVLIFLSLVKNCDCAGGNCDKKMVLTNQNIKELLANLPNSRVYEAPDKMIYASAPSPEITKEYDILASSLPPVTGFGINADVDPAMNVSESESTNIFYNWPANYDGGRLVRNARDFPLYPLPMPDKYEFGRMFYATYPEISYRPGFW